MNDDYVAVNRANWDARVPHHERGYGLEKFQDPDHLSETVRFDLPRLGDIAGKNTVHLQCHIGTVFLPAMSPRRGRSKRTVSDK